jgi:hypothetical protein
MNIHIEEKIAEDILDLAYKLARTVDDFQFEFTDATTFLESTSEPEYHFSADPNEWSNEMTALLDEASASLRLSQKLLKDMDAAIIKILAKRLELAEKTGIPLNLSESKQFARLVEFEV